MYKNLFIALLGLSLGATAFAEPTHPTTGKTMQHSNSAKPTNGMSASKMTCQDFLALEDIQRPKAVYWAEGLNKQGKVDDAVFDVMSTDNIVPMLVEECKATPAASFVKKAKVAKSKADMNK